MPLKYSLASEVGNPWSGMRAHELGLGANWERDVRPYNSSIYDVPMTVMGVTSPESTYIAFYLVMSVAA